MDFTPRYELGQPEEESTCRGLVLVQVDRVRLISSEERAALRRLPLVMQARTSDTVPVPLSTAERRNTLGI